jgi:hypothetical protein
VGNKLDAWDVLLEVTVRATVRVGDICNPVLESSGFGTFNDGGEGGIRTPDTLSGTLAFEASAFNHSATSPDLLAAMRKTIINEWLALGYSSGQTRDPFRNDKNLPKVNAARRYTPDLRSVSPAESRPC